MFSADDKVDFIGRAIDAGYFVRLFFVSTRHPSINAARITYRVMAGGHDVSIRKIVERWNQLLKRSGGPFLLSEWSIADAFYTPVATRFRTYGIHPSDYGDAGAAGAYAERLLETPEFLEWERASRAG